MHFDLHGDLYNLRNQPRNIMRYQDFHVVMKT